MKRLFSIVVSLLLIICCFAPCAFAKVTSSSSVSATGSSSSSASSSSTSSASAPHKITINVPNDDDDVEGDYYWVEKDGVKCHYDSKNVIVYPLYDDEDGTETSSDIVCYFFAIAESEGSEVYYFGAKIPEKGFFYDLGAKCVFYQTADGTKSVQLYGGEPFSRPSGTFGDILLNFALCAYFFAPLLFIAFIGKLISIKNDKELKELREVKAAAKKAAEEEDRKKAEEAARKTAKEASKKRALRTEAFEKLDWGMPALNICNRFKDVDHYVTHSEWESLRSEFLPHLDEASHLSDTEIRMIAGGRVFLRARDYTADENALDALNEEYLRKEALASESIFSNIGSKGKSLDDQQVKAALTDDDNTLVIAGAGSGKTLTIVGKVCYLVKRKHIHPANILVTSFTRNSTKELEDRIADAGIEGVNVLDLHAIGKRVLKEKGVCNENELSRCIDAYLSSDVLAHPDVLSAVLEFYGCYEVTQTPLATKGYSDLGSETEISSIKNFDLITLKQKLGSGGDKYTFQGEKVKSNEELAIANYLFLHGVDYEYEKNYDRPIPSSLTDESKSRYQPDFYLPEYDIWIEHFGIARDGIPHWIVNEFERQAYIEKMEWAREVHNACGSTLLETYSYWFQDQDLINQFERMLEEHGVRLERDQERLASLYEQLVNKKDGKELSYIKSLLSTFISLLKANDTTIPEVWDKGSKAFAGNGGASYRFNLFMTFAEPIYRYYQNVLEEKDQIDFDDMINLAAKRIQSEGYVRHVARIIVDEYQDMSMSKFNLVKAIRDATGARLFCVGDDWQSIYRFAGSDVTLFTNMSDFAGYTKRVVLENTYRNSQELVDIASGFICKNKSQLKKNVVSRSPKNAHVEDPIVAVATSPNVNPLEAFEFCLHKIIKDSEDEAATKKISVLGRQNNDIYQLCPELKGRKKGLVPSPDGSYSYEFEQDERTRDWIIRVSSDMDITFTTVHRAKGLEADYVIVLNMTDGLYGFPNLLSDDPITDLLLSHSDSYLHSEERRLFYVAITRAKRKVFLIGGDEDGVEKLSPFVKELMIDYDISYFYPTDGRQGQVRCPVCGGALVRRINSQTGEEFLGCSNYPFCEKSYSGTSILEDRVRCEKCGGWMRRVNGAHGTFYSCSNWPKCNYKFDVSSQKGEIESLDSSSSDQTFSVGDIVDHSNFGRGKVVKVDGDILHVRFANIGATKKLLKDYAPIKKVDEDY